MIEGTRRDFLRASATFAALGVSGGASVLLAACGGTTGTTATTETTWERVKRTKTVFIGLANEFPSAFLQGADLTGNMPDVIKATLGQKYGIDNVVATVTAFGSLIPGLQAKRYDMIGAGMFITPARCKQIAFSEPIAYSPDYALVKKGNPKGIHAANDLGSLNVKVAVQNGSFEQTFMKQIGVSDSNVFTVTSNIEEFSAVVSGRADVGLFNRPALQKFIADHQNEVEIADPWNPPVDPSTKQKQPAWPGAGFRTEDADFLKAWNDALAEIKTNGTLAQIVTKWGFTPVPADAPTAASICKA